MTVKILKGNCRDVLRSLDAESVQTCITSPPYWGLRDYGIPPSIWGGDPECEHDWNEETWYTEQSAGKSGAEAFSEAGPDNAARLKSARWRTAATCQHCQAWRGSFGLEPSPDLYVAHAVLIFREVARVLRPDGTLWLNLGDSYTSGGRGTYGTYSPDSKQATHTAIKSAKRAPQPAGLKPKDLVGIPWRVAFALQADGWYLRSDIIWSKPNPMPESVTDRPTKAHEYMFLFARSERYFYDAEAIKEQGVMKPQARLTPRDFVNGKDAQRSAHRRPGYRIRDEAEQENAMRNKRSVWEVCTAPFAQAHFATFPPDLIEPAIKAGTSEKGCCVKCGTAWKRVYERVATKEYRYQTIGIPNEGDQRGRHDEPCGSSQYAATGWEADCTCAADIAPCAVLDPFLGAGTTALVADRLGRNCIGIELNPDYADMAERRISGDGGMFASVEVSHGT